MDSVGNSSWIIEAEHPEDIDAIYQVNLQAFGRPGEAQVVDRLRENSPVFFSFVARVEGRVVGHLLFTPAQIVQVDDWTITGLGLAPLAVLPEFQRIGIGSALCREGLNRIQPEAYPFVIVLGHPCYYPRFGFEHASRYDIRCAYEDVPDEPFMIKILNPEKMAGVTGVAYYRPEFDSVS